MVSPTTPIIAGLLVQLKYVLLTVMAAQVDRSNMGAVTSLAELVEIGDDLRKANADLSSGFADLPPDASEEIQRALGNWKEDVRGFSIFQARERQRLIDMILDVGGSPDDEEVAHLVSAFGIETTPQHVKARRKARTGSLWVIAKPQRRAGQRRERARKIRKSTPQEKNAIRGFVRGGLTDPIKIKEALAMGIFPDVTLPSIRKVVADELKKQKAGQEVKTSGDGVVERDEEAVETGSQAQLTAQAQ